MSGLNPAAPGSGAGAGSGAAAGGPVGWLVSLASGLVGKLIGDVGNFILKQELDLVSQAMQSFSKSGMLYSLIGHGLGVGQILAGASGLAVGVLAVRVSWDAYQLATLRAEGAPTDPGGLFKRAGASFAAILAGPLLVSMAITFGNDLAAWIAGTPFATQLAGDANGMQAALASSGDAFWMAGLLIAGCFLQILIIVQAGIRSIEMAVMYVTAPFMALGFMSGGGTADVWWRELIVLACTQAVQLFCLFLGASVLLSPTLSGLVGVMKPFLFIGAAWVGFRTPHVLRQYAYHTGTGGAASGAGRMAVTSLLMRLPF